MKFGSWMIAGCTAVALYATMPAVRADTLDDIRKRGEMIVGVEAAYVPYEFIKDGEIIGYDIDIGNHLAAKLAQPNRLPTLIQQRKIRRRRCVASHGHHDERDQHCESPGKMPDRFVGTGV